MYEANSSLTIFTQWKLQPQPAQVLVVIISQYGKQEFIGFTV